MTKKYNYTIFTWAKYFYGPVFLIAGAFVFYQFVIGIKYSVENGAFPVKGYISEIFLIYFLWLLFFSGAGLLTTFGVWILESDRNSWAEGGFLHTTRGIIPVFHKKYSREEVLHFEIVKKAAFMIVPLVGTSVNKAYMTGYWFHLEAVLKNGRISIARFMTEQEAGNAKREMEKGLNL